MSNREKQLLSNDVMVLGAGIVGVSTALHLRRLGLDVALIDRQHPGEEASYGNAGIVQRNGFVPHSMPRNPLEVLEILLNQSTAVSYRPATLLKLAPWLKRFREAGSDRAIERYSRIVAPLRALAVEEHLELARSTNADRFYRGGGWLHLFRGETSFRKSEAERLYARVFGVAYDELGASGATALEPGLKISNMKAIHWKESYSVSNPGGVVDAFWRGYVREGGDFHRGDALKLRQERGGWVVDGEKGPVFARHVVVALGAWSLDILKRLGESYPLAVKRGYHMHYRPLSGASLSRPVVDVDNGFALTPTDNGIRLTTGVELAERDAVPNPLILKRVKKRADELFPLGRKLLDEPWLGCRPCLPDSLPVVGASPKTRGLWFNFGHAHDGFTLGPITGRLLAELIVGKAPVLDISGLSPERFVG
ncbi:MAG: FAD-binding oxidoreductase [Roseibium sp.]|uniref:NAD(P)/FAD-dependent oxidoreductase n=1 Tax=Roseibium sp. TaxID=1936156 RepID=UPI001B0F04C5|nr:FAD-binding oxidoreductase [Roseibium sp.]MBO6894803.1 FAD-binding oxidoreductase [Roseibium sp.]MBO6929390.1 FAD-binding oxidoreductase [Roseibium sp.]